MKDFNGVEIEVGDTVAYIEKGYRNFVRGVITKVNEKKVAISLNGRVKIGDDSTSRFGVDVIVIKKAVKVFDAAGQQIN